MKKVIINEELCVGCGQCAADCVSFDIELVNGKAKSRNLGCIGCGHCQAICKQNAIKLEGFNDQIYDFDNQTRVDPDTLLRAIKERRSIRSFLDKEVENEKIDMIFEAGRCAPTGANRQSIVYVRLKNKKEECEKVALKKFRRLIGFGRKFIPMLKNMELTDDFFFKGAPLVICICSPDKVSASLAAENMAFMAESLGLGVLFSGFYTSAVNKSRKLKKIMGLKKKQKVVTTLVIGYSKYKYFRTVHRNDLCLINA